jgi:hypothetical protein
VEVRCVAEVLDEQEVGPPPLRRAVQGLALGLAAGLVAVLIVPREPRSTDARRPEAGAR